MDRVDWVTIVMPLTDEEYNRNSTFFGVWPETKAARVSELLDGLGVRYEFVTQEESEESLKSWLAWEPTNPYPHIGYFLYIHSDDLEKVGKSIVELYPERKFGAK